MTAISKAIDTAIPMAMPIIESVDKLTALKQKWGQLPGNSTNKQAKKNWAVFGFYCVFGFFQDASNLHIKALSLKVT